MRVAKNPQEWVSYAPSSCIHFCPLQQIDQMSQEPPLYRNMIRVRFLEAINRKSESCEVMTAMNEITTFSDTLQTKQVDGNFILLLTIEGH